MDTTHCRKHLIDSVALAPIYSAFPTVGGAIREQHPPLRSDHPRTRLKTRSKGGTGNLPLSNNPEPVAPGRSGVEARRSPNGPACRRSWCFILLSTEEYMETSFYCPQSPVSAFSWGVEV